MSTTEIRCIHTYIAIWFVCYFGPLQRRRTVPLIIGDNNTLEGCFFSKDDFPAVRLFFFLILQSRCDDITFALIMRQERRHLQDDFVILGGAGEIALRIDSLCHVHPCFATNLPTLMLEPEYSSISKARISSYSSDRIHSVRVPLLVFWNQLVTLNFSSRLVSLNKIEYESYGRYV